MNSIQIAIIGLALSLNAFPAFLSAGFVMKTEKASKILRYAFIMILTQAIMTGAGLWLGLRLGVFATESNFYIAAGILLFVSLKILFDSIKIRPESRTFDLSETRAMIMLSIAEGITPLITGIAIGLLVPLFLLPWLILIVILLFALTAGLITGNHYGRNSLRFRTGPIGGLILLAASLKLILDFIGF